MQTAQLIRSALATVPQEFKEGFISHATAIWNKKIYRPRWDLESRLAFLHRMMSIPFQAGLGIVYGAVRRDGAPITDNPLNLPKEGLDHMVAFGLCVGTADQYIRDRAASNEIATVVAEDSQKMRAALRAATASLQVKPLKLGGVGSTATGGARLATEGHEIRVTRVVDTVHYAAKNEAIILQLADACAFGLRRYFAGQSTGNDFARSITGGTPLDLLTKPIGAGIFQNGTTGLYDRRDDQVSLDEVQRIVI